MRICAISDTHESHEEITENLFPADVLVHAGDMTYMGTVNALMSVNKWFGDIKNQFGYKKIIVVPGNHDWLFQKDPGLARTIMQNADVLIDQGLVFEGKQFWGSPRTPWFHSWAFNQERGEDIRRFWDIIPKDTDVLITHGPANGILDLVNPTSVYHDRVGCEDLREAVERVQPKAFIFGHIHGSYGAEAKYWFDTGKTTTCVNASIMDEIYMPRHKPLLVEI